MSHDISNHLVDKIRTSKARICLQLDKSTEYQMKYICCFTVDKYMLDAKKEVAFSSVFIFFEAFRLTLVKKNRQNEGFFILTVLLDKCQTKSFEEYEHTTESNTQVLYHQPTFQKRSS